MLVRSSAEITPSFHYYYSPLLFDVEVLDAFPEASSRFFLRQKAEGERRGSRKENAIQCSPVRVERSAVKQREFRTVPMKFE